MILYYGFFDLRQKSGLFAQTAPYFWCMDVKNAVTLHPRKAPRWCIQDNIIKDNKKKGKENEKIVFNRCSYAEHDYDICRR
jgi:hypothetical protein